MKTTFLYFVFSSLISSKLLFKRQDDSNVTLTDATTTTETTVNSEATESPVYAMIDGKLVVVKIINIVNAPIITDTTTISETEPEPTTTTSETEPDPTTTTSETEPDPTADIEGVEELNFCQLQGFSEDQIADGTQQQTSTCSLTVLGALPDFDNMVSTVITSPLNGATITLGENFTVSIVSININYGFFDDPASEYYLTPQTLGENGNINGHNHITIQKINNPFLPPDPSSPIFFKGLNEVSVNGTLSVEVDGGLFLEDGPGDYRICTITASQSHASVLLPVARRGTADDCIRVLII